VYIADTLLQSHGFSYAGHNEIPPELLASLGLKAGQVDEVFSNLMEKKNDILSFSAQLIH
jgi:hypothetical protein